MTYSILLEKLLRDIGGCGKFQWLLAVVASLAAFTECWSMLHMSFTGQEPNFFCSRKSNASNATYVQTGSCSETNVTDCSTFHFDDEMHTIVSEVSFSLLYSLTCWVNISETIF